jgi:hypothetical protein
VADELAGHRLMLCGPNEVAGQVCSAATQYVASPIGRARRDGWTHVLRAPGPVHADIVGLLRLLTAVVTLPPPRDVGIAIALDWYKLAIDSVDPWSWPNTEVAELVYRGKYARIDPARRNQAGRELTRRICEAVRAHPPAKNAYGAGRRASIKNQFLVQDDLHSHCVLIVDDVYRSGTSMSEAGRAAMVAGASRAFGIAAARTRRSG